MSNMSCTCSANESGTPALTRLAALIARLDALDAALDFADVAEIPVDALLVFAAE
jgi:hypothetical protein